MCDPMTALAAASVAASVGGAVHNTAQQNAAASANNAAQEREAARRAQAMRDERARQAALDEQARGVNAQALAANQREAVVGQQAAAEAPRQEAVDRALVLPDMQGPTEAAVSATTQDAARVVADRLGAARQGMLANAYLRAIGDQQAGTARNLQLSNNDLDLIAGARRGSLAAYNVNMSQQPQSFRPGASMLGDAALAAGRLGMSYAGGQMGAAAANPATGAGAPTARMSIGNDFGNAVPDFSWQRR